MIDKKEQFIMALKGKQYKGHLHKWEQNKFFIAGRLGEDCFLTHKSRDFEIIEERLLIFSTEYYTLGELLND